MSRAHVPAALRRLVVTRAGDRCEYCRIPAAAVFVPLEIDHVVAEKHGGATDESNLALSCLLCNKHKGSDLTTFDPSTAALVRLFHPRRDAWAEHFQLSADGEICGRTAEGRATVRLLRLDDAARTTERRLLLRAGLLVVA